MPACRYKHNLTYFQGVLNTRACPPKIRMTFGVRRLNIHHISSVAEISCLRRVKHHEVFATIKLAEQSIAAPRVGVKAGASALCRDEESACRKPVLAGINELAVSAIWQHKGIARKAVRTGPIL